MKIPLPILLKSLAVVKINEAGVCLNVHCESCLAGASLHPLEATTS